VTRKNLDAGGSFSCWSVMGLLFGISSFKGVSPATSPHAVTYSSVNSKGMGPLSRCKIVERFRIPGELQKFQGHPTPISSGSLSDPIPQDALRF
jgi:hypothetical protein